MASIDRVTQLAWAMRQELAAVQRAAEAPRAGRPGAGGPARTRPRTGKVFEHVAARLHAVDPNDPGRGRKAFGYFLEAVLLRELGANLINDPGFYDLVDTVRQRMEQEPALAADIAAASAYLAGAAEQKE